MAKWSFREIAIAVYKGLSKTKGSQQEGYKNAASVSKGLDWEMKRWSVVKIL